MTWEPRPTPNINPETEPYWEAAADERLLVQECQDCELVYAYPRAFCPDCFSDEVEWIEANGTGEVYTYTVSRQMSGWPEDKLPLILAYVELDEGPRITTNVVDCDPEDIKVGTSVEVQFVETENESVGIPVFTPV
jgi:uncharacterized OB-fold protein